MLPSAGRMITKELFLAMKPLCKLSDTHIPHDPYRKISQNLMKLSCQEDGSSNKNSDNDGTMTEFGIGHLYYDIYEQVEIIGVKDVPCHIVRTKLTVSSIGPCVHILPLNRVHGLIKVSAALLNLDSMQMLTSDALSFKDNPESNDNGMASDAEETEVTQWENVKRDDPY
ncbi:hypothetical protein EW146_g8247 [Bondarzewia mesenterica]|uniref:Uncharacterized protein n=1 Tax=Bondarzewia mesenterica TaxID=1095465 RepID=A0A4S4LFX3_9AGAM|nr:hypothetical protein EW146_g8247 [Bondarzewia mesenterica]